MRLGLAIALSSCALLAHGGRASADDFEDFQAARTAYEAHEYADAARQLESMVGGAVPRVQDRTLINESRELLAATYLFLRREDDAREQFLALLRVDDTYEVDSHQFPTAVVDLFRDVRTAFLAEREREREEERDRLERENRDAVQRMLRQQERMARLEELAQEVRTERQNSRLLALLPFGVGQFQNGQRRLGLTFAVLESALTVLSFATWGWHRWVANHADRVENFTTLERTSRLMNQTLMATLGIVAIAGIVQAQAAYVPVVTRVERRPLPDDLPEMEPMGEPAPAPATQVEASVGVGVGTLQLHLAW